MILDYVAYAIIAIFGASIGWAIYDSLAIRLILLVVGIGAAVAWAVVRILL